MSRNINYIVRVDGSLQFPGVESKISQEGCVTVNTDTRDETVRVFIERQVLAEPFVMIRRYHKQQVFILPRGSSLALVKVDRNDKVEKVYDWWINP